MYILVTAVNNVFYYIERPDGTPYSHEIVLRAIKVIL